MAHRTARLNVFGRQLLVTTDRASTAGRWPRAAEAQGVSRTTAHKWVGPVSGRGLGRARGPQLASASLAPPHPARGRSAAILRARVERRWGPHRLGTADRLTALDRVRASCARTGLQPAARRRPLQRRPGPLRRVIIRARSSTRTTRSSGASPTGGGHRSPRASRGRGQPSARRPRLRPPRGRRRRRQPASPYRRPGPRRERDECRLGLLLDAAVFAFAEPRRPDRAGPDRQRPLAYTRVPTYARRARHRSAPATSGRVRYRPQT